MLSAFLYKLLYEMFYIFGTGAADSGGSCRLLNLLQRRSAGIDGIFNHTICYIHTITYYFIKIHSVPSFPKQDVQAGTVLYDSFILLRKTKDVIMPVRRHDSSFAQAEQNGRPAEDSVPFLSVYLGHHDMDETEKYLKFSGDMFPEYIELFEDFASGVFAEVAYEE